MRFIIVGIITVLLGATAVWAKKKSGKGNSALADSVTQVGLLEHPQLKECSGIVRSLRYTNVFWTHTDGKKPVLFAVTKEGKTVGTFPVKVKLNDWEDLAIDGENNLYIADTGNNDLKRKTLVIHRLEEPSPATPSQTVVPNQTWILLQPSVPMDCESFFVHAGRGYLVSKVFKGKKAEIFSFALGNTEPSITLESLGTVPVTDPVTSASLSADAMQLALLTHSGLHLLQLSKPFPSLTPEKVLQYKTGDRHLEGCTFVHEGVLAAAETREVLLFPIEN